MVHPRGGVHPPTIQVVSSDDVRFSESVRAALGLMRFRPARRGGKPVRQTVEQQFRFQIQPSTTLTQRIG